MDESRAHIEIREKRGLIFAAKILDQRSTIFFDIRVALLLV